MWSTRYPGCWFTLGSVLIVSVLGQLPDAGKSNLDDPCIAASCITGTICTYPECSSPPCRLSPQCYSPADDMCAAYPNLCHNGGMCVTTGNHSYTCECTGDYTGKYCHRVTPGTSCNSGPCLNGGSCTDLGGWDFHCSCPANFLGTNCEMELRLSNISACQNVQCREGSLCVPVVNYCNSDNCPVIPFCAALNPGTCPYVDAAAAIASVLSGNETCEFACSFDASCLDGQKCCAQGCSTRCVQAENIGASFCEQKRSEFANLVRTYKSMLTVDYITYGQFLNSVGSTLFPGGLGQLNPDLLNSFTNLTIAQLVSYTTKFNAFPRYTCSPEGSFEAVQCDYFVNGTRNRCFCVDRSTGIPSGVSVSTPNSTCPAGLGCESAPCLNSGSCYLGANGGYSCSCTPGWSGRHCEVWTSSQRCDSSPCLYGGSCYEDSEMGFRCSCLGGYTGIYCETRTDLLIVSCDSSPCLNGGTCYVDRPGFMCSCPMGYTGAFCEIRKNICESNPCENGGTCTESDISGYVCTCDSAWTGPNCSIPTGILNVCETPNFENFCIHGRCHPDAITGVLCICDPGYMGFKCERPVMKPGVCPEINPVALFEGLTSGGDCEPVCTTDSHCPGEQRCCMDGCKGRCIQPVDLGMPLCMQQEEIERQARSLIQSLGSQSQTYRLIEPFISTGNNTQLQQLMAAVTGNYDLDLFYRIYGSMTFYMLASAQSLLLQNQVRCTSLGKFEDLQCFGNNSNCYCVRQTGIQNFGSFLLPGNTNDSACEEDYVKYTATFHLPATPWYPQLIDPASAMYQQLQPLYQNLFHRNLINSTYWGRYNDIEFLGFYQNTTFTSLQMRISFAGVFSRERTPNRPQNSRLIPIDGKLLTYVALGKEDINGQLTFELYEDPTDVCVGYCSTGQRCIKDVTCTLPLCPVSLHCLDMTANPCEGYSLCLNGGSCSFDLSTEQGFTCICPDGYSGNQCQISATRTTCNDNNGGCLNLGLCQTAGSIWEIHCLCQTGFSGEKCEIAPMHVCLYRSCPENQFCVEDKLCSEDGKCIPTAKCMTRGTGSCPHAAITDGILSQLAGTNVCRTECSSDSDCNIDEKCCSDAPCVRLCKKAVIAGTPCEQQSRYYTHLREEMMRLSEVTQYTYQDYLEIYFQENPNQPALLPISNAIVDLLRNKTLGDIVQRVFRASPMPDIQCLSDGSYAPKQCTKDLKGDPVNCYCVETMYGLKLGAAVPWNMDLTCSSEKFGYCPLSHLLNTSCPLADMCSKDMDCPASQKCCESNCGKKQCVEPVDGCSLKPCQNGGSCSPDFMMIGKVICDCPEGFTGEKCETRLPTPCDVNPCLNGGTCRVAEGNLASCDCSFPYRDRLCEATFLEVDPCETVTCGGLEVCLVKEVCEGNPEQCVNQAGCFGGSALIQSLCSVSQTKILCPSSAICYTDTYRNHRCVCRQGFSGENCQVRALKSGNCPPLNITELISNQLMQEGCPESCNFEFDCEGTAKCCPFTDTCGNTCMEPMTDMSICEAQRLNVSFVMGALQYLKGLSGVTFEEVYKNVDRSVLRHILQLYKDVDFTDLDVIVNYVGDESIGKFLSTVEVNKEIATVSCTPDGRFAPVQCQGLSNGAMQQCSCVNVLTGEKWGDMSASPNMNCTEKLGTCPDSASSTCRESCSADNECSEGKKCCEDSCGGSSCHRPVELGCAHKPCINGECIPVGSDDFACLCNSGFTGTLCESSIGTPCSRTPNLCLNGGTCVANGPNQFTCYCNYAYTGRNCESYAMTTTTTATTPVHISSCQYHWCPSGTYCEVQEECMSGNGHFGECRQTPRCKELPSCKSNPCMFGSTCMPDNRHGYRCLCAEGFVGKNCDYPDVRVGVCPRANIVKLLDRVVMSVSSINFNCYLDSQCGEGRKCCSSETGTSCIVPMYRDRSVCEQQRLTMSLMNETITNVTRVSNISLNQLLPYLQSSSVRSYFKQVFQIDLVNLTVNLPSDRSLGRLLNLTLPYVALPFPNCSLNGNFRPVQCLKYLNGSEQLCYCANVTSGERIGDQMSYSPWRPTCKDANNIDACRKYEICQNGGTCFQNGPYNYTCLCYRGYYGRNCEHYSGFNYCERYPNVCGNGGSCMSSGYNNYTCHCYNNYYGPHCEYHQGYSTPPPSVCLNYFCPSGTYCEVQEECMSGNGHSGQCRQIPHCKGYPSCNTSPCMFGSTCLPDNRYGYRCLCTEGFVGKNCDYPDVRDGVCPRANIVKLLDRVVMSASSINFNCYLDSQCGEGRKCCSSETGTSCIIPMYRDRSVCEQQRLTMSLMNETITNVTRVSNISLNQLLPYLQSSSVRSYFKQVFQIDLVNLTANLPSDRSLGSLLNLTLPYVALPFPNCSLNGNFRPVQCLKYLNGSEQLCYCANVTSGERIGDQMSYSPWRPTCKDASNIDACKKQGICQNGGSCLQNGPYNYTCLCYHGYYGRHCEHYSGYNYCERYPNVCGNGGSCVSSGYNNYTCYCYNNYYGPHCEYDQGYSTPPPSVCLNYFCPSGTYCEVQEECMSGNGHSGQCRQIPHCKGYPSCNTSPCMFGSTCLPDNRYGYRCLCTEGFVGKNCDYPDVRDGVCPRANIVKLLDRVVMSASSINFNCYLDSQCGEGRKCCSSETGTSCIIPMYRDRSVCEQQRLTMSLMNETITNMTRVSNISLNQLLPYLQSSSVRSYFKQVFQIDLVNLTANLPSDRSLGRLLNLTLPYVALPFPNCSLNGNFRPVQCLKYLNGSEQLCYCANVTSGERIGDQMSYSPWRPTCKDASNIDACKKQGICQNGGSCLQNGPYNYTCLCYHGYYGRHCEHYSGYNYCERYPNVCGNGGSCVSSGYNNYTCYCYNNYYGPHCEYDQGYSTPPPSVCLNYFCPSGTYCEVQEECMSGNGHSGQCRQIPHCKGYPSCNTSPCMFGSTCLPDNRYGYRCLCTEGFVGKNCDYPDVRDGVCPRANIVKLLDRVVMSASSINFNCYLDSQCGEGRKCCSSETGTSCIVPMYRDRSVCEQQRLTMSLMNETITNVTRVSNISLNQLLPYLQSSSVRSYFKQVFQIDLVNLTANLPSDRSLGSLLNLTLPYVALPFPNCSLNGNFRPVQCLKYLNGSEQLCYCANVTSGERIGDQMSYSPWRPTCKDASNIDACKKQGICQNGGSCLQNGPYNYTCLCYHGYYGRHCEHYSGYNYCERYPNVCGNGGSCVSSGYNNYTCYCYNNYYGPHCEYHQGYSTPSPSVCLNYFCPSGTYCEVQEECMSGNGHSGQCRQIPHCKGYPSCNTSPCMFGSTCLPDNRYGYRCLCTEGFVGKNCDYPDVRDGVCPRANIVKLLDRVVMSASSINFNCYLDSQCGEGRKCCSSETGSSCIIPMYRDRSVCEQQRLTMSLMNETITNMTRVSNISLNQLLPSLQSSSVRSYFKQVFQIDLVNLTANFPSDRSLGRLLNLTLPYVALPFPNCSLNGNFRPVQCLKYLNGSEQLCYCANVTSGERIGDQMSYSPWRPTCKDASNIDACKKQGICQNGGSCLQNGPYNYTCLCYHGYYGRHCEHYSGYNYCERYPNVCGNGGSCVSSGYNNYTCYCYNNYYGPHCEYDQGYSTPPPSVCLNYFCPSGTYCEVQEECMSGNGHSGQCRQIPHCKGYPSCNTSPCMFGSTCLPDNRYGYRCLCTEGFVGKNCDYPDVRDGVCPRANIVKLLDRVVMSVSSINFNCYLDSQCGEGRKCCSSETGSSCIMPMYRDRSVCEQQRLTMSLMNETITNMTRVSNISLNQLLPSLQSSSVRSYFKQVFQIDLVNLTANLPSDRSLGSLLNLTLPYVALPFPNCSLNGNFRPVQCLKYLNGSEQLCYCANVTSGERIGDQMSYSPWRPTCKDASNIDACKKHGICQNGGSCSQNGPYNYTCLCYHGYYGRHCEHYSGFNYCQRYPNVCGNGGSCMRRGYNNYTCHCYNNYYGPHCEYHQGYSTPPPSVCLNYFCPSGTYCEVQEECMSRNGHSGQCRQIPHCKGYPSCNTSPCMFGSTCLPDNRYGYRCLCTEGFVGKNCDYPDVRDGVCPRANIVKLLDRVVMSASSINFNCYLDSQCGEGRKCCSSETGTSCIVPMYRDRSVCEQQRLTMSLMNETITSVTRVSNISLDQLLPSLQSSSVRSYFKQVFQIDLVNLTANFPSDRSLGSLLNLTLPYVALPFPNCSLNGNFRPVQCLKYLNGSEQLCYCANVTSGERIGDQMSYSPWRPTCKDASNIDACKKQGICQNGGSCLQNGPYNYTCLCYHGYYGRHCEHYSGYNYCERYPNVCGNGGSCVSSGYNNYTCHCYNNYYGPHCEYHQGYSTPPPSVCLNYFCPSGTYCEVQEECMSRNGHSGQCRQIPHCKGYPSCNTSPCMFGSTCLPDNRYGYRCLCTEGFVGKNCDYPDVRDGVCPRANIVKLLDRVVMSASSINFNCYLDSQCGEGRKCCSSETGTSCIVPMYRDRSVCEQQRLTMSLMNETITNVTRVSNISLNQLLPSLQSSSVRSYFKQVFQIDLVNLTANLPSDRSLGSLLNWTLPYVALPFPNCSLNGNFRPVQCLKYLNGSEQLCYCANVTSGERIGDQMSYSPWRPTCKAEDNIDMCKRNSGICKNGGSCVERGPNGYTCLCPNDYTGRHCESYSYPHPCDSFDSAGYQVACRNGGSCVPRGNDFTCYCFGYYYGDHCEYQYNFSRPAEDCPLLSLSRVDEIVKNALNPGVSCDSSCASDTSCSSGQKCCTVGCHSTCSDLVVSDLSECQQRNHTLELLYLTLSTLTSSSSLTISEIINASQNMTIVQEIGQKIWPGLDFDELILQFGYMTFNSALPYIKAYFKAPSAYCSADGYFSARQCDLNADREEVSCYCVDGEGRERYNTKNRPSIPCRDFTCQYAYCQQGTRCLATNDLGGYLCVTPDYSTTPTTSSPQTQCPEKCGENYECAQTDSGVYACLPLPLTCEPGQIKCVQKDDVDETCVISDFICDGDDDCIDGRDEANCTNTNVCPFGTRKCRDGEKCVLEEYWCDRSPDCKDNSDEDSCPIPDGLWSLVGPIRIDQDFTEDLNDPSSREFRAIVNQMKQEILESLGGILHDVIILGVRNGSIIIDVQLVFGPGIVVVEDGTTPPPNTNATVYTVSQIKQILKEQQEAGNLSEDIDVDAIELKVVVATTTTSMPTTRWTTPYSPVGGDSCPLVSLSRAEQIVKDAFNPGVSCASNCDQDANCAGNIKCCTVGCYSTCVTPVELDLSPCQQRNHSMELVYLTMSSLASTQSSKTVAQVITASRKITLVEEIGRTIWPTWDLEDLVQRFGSVNITTAQPIIEMFFKVPSAYCNEDGDFSMRQCDLNSDKEELSCYCVDRQGQERLQTRDRGSASCRDLTCQIGWCPGGTRCQVTDDYGDYICVAYNHTTTTTSKVTMVTTSASRVPTTTSSISYESTTTRPQNTCSEPCGEQYYCGQTEAGLYACLPLPLTCEPGEIKCVEKGGVDEICVIPDFICDEDEDCDDGSDEANCPSTGVCPSGTRGCRNGEKCILETFWCDKIQDCSDNSDEDSCPITADTSLTLNRNFTEELNNPDSDAYKKLETDIKAQLMAALGDILLDVIIIDIRNGSIIIDIQLVFGPGIVVVEDGTTPPPNTNATVYTVSQIKQVLKQQQATGNLSPDIDVDAIQLTVGGASIPATTTRVTEGTTSRGTPTVVATTPSTTRSTPTVVATTPSTTRSTPTVVATTPSTTRSTPTVVATTPSTTRSTPTMAATTPSTARSTPTVVATTPSTTRSTPIVVATTPSTTRSTPSVVATTPSTTRSTPSVVATSPSTTRSTPSAVATSPSTTRSTPSVVATTPSTTRSTPSVVATTPSTTRSTPSVVATSPSTTRSTPSVVATTPSTTRSTPSVVATTPSTTRSTPSVVATSPSTTRSTPSVVATSPSSTRSTPSVVATTPSTTRSTPSVVATTPSTIRSTPTEASTTSSTPSVVTSSTASSSMASTSTTSAPSVLLTGEVTVNREWSNDLADNSSVRYRTLVADLTPKINYAFSLLLRKYNPRNLITRFWRGSVVVSFVLGLDSGITLLRDGDPKPLNGDFMFVSTMKLNLRNMQSMGMISNDLDANSFQINVPRVCPSLTTCTLMCEFGRVLDLNRCPTCQCFSDPCQALNCPETENCVIYSNSTAECKAEKPGFCPFGEKLGGSCDRECRYDAFCPNQQKCCSGMCGTFCVDPLETAPRQLTDCEKKLSKVSEYLKHSPSAPLSIPRCEMSDGSWSPVQCHDSWGICFCVDTDGEMIKGSEIRGTPDCSQNFDDSAMTVSPVCESGVEIHQCDPSLCLTSVCTKNETAVCRINPCGGCRAEFYDNNNNLIDCDAGFLTSCEFKRGNRLRQALAQHIVSAVHEIQRRIDLHLKGKRMFNLQPSVDDLNYYDIDQFPVDICMLEFSGSNTGSIKWYFDPNIRLCVQGRFSGRGNLNVFSSETECQRQCAESSSAIPFFQGPVIPSCDAYKQCHRGTCWCSVDDDNIMTRGNLQCDGNGVTSLSMAAVCPDGSSPEICEDQCADATCNFNPQAKCYADPCDDCRVVFTSQEGDVIDCQQMPVCSLPMEVGTCSLDDKRWYYDPEANACKMFTFGGCNGNNNNFLSRGACEAACRQPTEEPLCMIGQPSICMNECANRRCGFFPEAVCRVDICNNCSVEFFNPETDLPIDCDRLNTKCLRDRAWKRSLSALPSYIPQCAEADGEYNPVQCDQSECWCVDGEGSEIMGARLPAINRPYLNCRPNKTVEGKVRFKFEGEFDDVGGENENSFKDAIARALAELLKGGSQILKIELTRGSIIAVVTFVDNVNTDLSEVLNVLNSKVVNSEMSVSFGNKTYMADKTDFSIVRKFQQPPSVETTLKPTTPSGPDTTKVTDGKLTDQDLQIAIIVGSISGVVVLAVIVALVVVYCKRQQQEKADLNYSEAGEGAVPVDNAFYFSNPTGLPADEYASPEPQVHNIYPSLTKEKRERLDDE